MRSLSFVFPLPERTDLKLRFHNTRTVRLLMAITQEKPGKEDEPVLDSRLLLPQEQSELTALGLPFVLTLLPDRLTISIYGIYQAEFYRSVLDLLYRVYQRVLAQG